MKWYHYIIIGIAIPLLVWLSFHIGYNKGRREPIASKVDTLTVYKERVSIRPKEVLSLNYSNLSVPAIVFQTDTLTQIIYQHDTLTLPTEHKRYYQPNEYELEISGIAPRLDYIKTYTKEQIVTNTVKPRWSFGVQLGIGCQYGLIRRQFDAGPYLGIGVEYNF